MANTIQKLGMAGLMAGTSFTASAQTPVSNLQESLGIVTEYIGVSLKDAKIGNAEFIRNQSFFVETSNKAIKEKERGFDFTIKVSNAFDPDNFKGKFQQCVDAVGSVSYKASFLVSYYEGKTRVDFDESKPVTVTKIADMSKACINLVKKGGTYETVSPVDLQLYKNNAKPFSPGGR